MAVMRPGPDPKWLGVWQAQLLANDKYRAGYHKRNLERLHFYIAEGYSPAPTDKTAPPIAVDPPWAGWEAYLESDLDAYAAELERTFEQKSIVEGQFDSGAAAAAFAAAYTRDLISLRAHALFPLRFPGRILQMLSVRSVAFTALGLCTGASNEALGLARAQLAAWKRGYVFDAELFPVLAFMLRLFSDVLGEGVMPVKGEAAGEPILLQLYDNWRSDELNLLGDLCTAACDVHTHRCTPARGEHYHEFDNGNWMRLPIEILLLFKLRERACLSNPAISHPLMDTVLGQLPPETGFKPDVLVSDVLSRLHDDGFDESAILAMYD